MSATLDIDAALRWFRFGSRDQLRRRPDAELPFALDQGDRVQGLLLDTCVYIDQLRDRLPDPVARFIETRPLHHSTVAIQELMFGIGALDQKGKRTQPAVLALRTLIRAMRPHRTFAPDPDLLARAALLSGLLCRLQGYQGDSRMRTLMDATLFLQARKLGLLVVTRNIGDFDLLLQLIPSGHALFYRTEPGEQATAL